MSIFRDSILLLTSRQGYSPRVPPDPIRRALAASVLVSCASDAYFVATGGVTVPGILGAVCVAIAASSAIKRGAVRSAYDAILVAVCIGVGTVFFLSAFPAPAMAALKMPGMLSTLRAWRKSRA